MAAVNLYSEFLPLPRAVRFPVELEPPAGFDPERLESWPVLDGRLEYVEGRLLYLPPCAADQGRTVVDVIAVLLEWQSRFPEFEIRSNEAGMMLGGATRAADVAVWRRADLGSEPSGLARVPPLLAVEVAGRDDDESYLRQKAQWYIQNGVTTVWIVLPDTREVLVIGEAIDARFGRGASISEDAALPGLSPRVVSLFRQIDALR